MARFEYDMAKQRTIFWIAFALLYLLAFVDVRFLHRFMQNMGLVESIGPEGTLYRSALLSLFGASIVILVRWVFRRLRHARDSEGSSTTFKWSVGIAAFGCIFVAISLIAGAIPGNAFFMLALLALVIAVFCALIFLSFFLAPGEAGRYALLAIAFLVVSLLVWLGLAIAYGQHALHSEASPDEILVILVYAGACLFVVRQAYRSLKKPEPRPANE